MDDSPTGPIQRAFRDHPATVIAVLTATLVTLRLIAIAGYHVGVALQLLAAAGAPNILIGTVITLIPTFLPAAPGLALSLTFFAPRFASRRLLMVWLTALVSVLALQVAPIFLLLMFTLVLPMASFYQRRASKRRNDGQPPQGDWAVPLIAVLGIVLSWNAPWFAPEIVQVGNDHVYGYVVASDGQWTQILQDRNREILIVPSSTVVNRAPCQQAPQVLSVTLRDLLYPRTDIGPCPPPGQEPLAADSICQPLQGGTPQRFDQFKGSGGRHWTRTNWPHAFKDQQNPLPV